MKEEQTQERIKQGRAIRRELKNEIKGERDPLRQDQLRIHLMQLDATILAYRKCTRAYARDHQARRAKAQAAGVKRFVHLNEWFRVGDKC